MQSRDICPRNSVYGKRYSMAAQTAEISGMEEKPAGETATAVASGMASDMASGSDVASKKAVPDRLLACTICHNAYTLPVTLQCGHTFCQSCVTEYTRLVPLVTAQNLVPCILGCPGTKVPDPSKPMDEWAKQLKPSLLIKGLMEIASSTEVRVCSVCEAKDKSSPAVRLCTACEKGLCKDCLPSHMTDSKTRHHDLLDLTKPKAKFDTCPEHLKVMNVECEVCDVRACSICWCLVHRACAVAGTPEARRASRESYLLEEQRKTNEKLERAEAAIAKHKSTFNAIVRNKNQSQTEIHDAFQKLIRIVRDKELVLLDELECITAQQEIDMELRLKTKQANLQVAKQQLQFIEELETSGSMEDTINMYQYVVSGQAALDRGEGREFETDHIPVTDVTFTHDTSAILGALGRLDFGTVIAGEEQVTDGTNMSAKLDIDSREPGLYELTVVVVDGIHTLVATDQENKCVKAFYTRNNTACHSNLPLDDVPNGIAYLQEDKVLIPSTWSRQIVTVKVTPDLEFVSSVVTEKGYNSLAVLSPTSLAASSGLFQCVDILDMSGKLLKSFGGAESHSSMFTNPWYMCARNDRLLVSDRGRKAIVCMTTDGELLWTYAPTGLREMALPSGITTTSAGSVVVADREGSKLIVLSKSGQFVRDILTTPHGISEPQGVSAHDAAMFVCGDGRIKRVQITM